MFERITLFQCNAAVHTGRLATIVMVGGLSMTAIAQNQLPPAIPQDRNIQEPAQESVQTNTEEVSVMTRGPLHEAYATVYTNDPQPEPIFSVQPPEPIDEIPPAYKPDGENIEWIPGYWAMDEDQDKFVWISGIWREVPPGQQWITGYWDQIENGWRRVSGFWTSSSLEQVEYLPIPPEAVENGPSSPSPGPNYFYVPGNWVDQGSGYVWQAGYWSPAYQHWVWVPAQYYWTPRGCVYAAGYWDYEFSNRGVVFAPVYISQQYYSQPNYWYTPNYVIDVDTSLLVHLFVRSDNRHYYFGDYYGNDYASNYHPWYEQRGQHYHYDPLSAYYQIDFRGDTGNVMPWVRQQHDWFEHNQNARPPRTLRQQADYFAFARQSNIDESMIRLATLGESIEDVAQSGALANGQLGQLTREQRQDLRSRAKAYQGMAQQRNQVEKARSSESDRSVSGRTKDQIVPPIGADGRDRDREKVGETRNPNQPEQLDLRNWRQRLSPSEGKTGDQRDQKQKSGDQRWKPSDRDPVDSQIDDVRKRLNQRPARPADWPKVQTPEVQQKLPELPKGADKLLNPKQDRRNDAPDQKGNQGGENKGQGKDKKGKGDDKNGKGGGK